MYGSLWIVEDWSRSLEPVFLFDLLSKLIDNFIFFHILSYKMIVAILKSHFLIP